MTPERWQEIKTLFVALMDLPPEERSAHLDQACASDPELRREMERLLTSLAREPDFMESAVLPGGAGRFVEALADDFAASVADRTPSRSGLTDDPSVGVALNDLPGPAPTVCGRYSILGEIGRGGMGVVYRAEDRLLARLVAVKVLKEAVFLMEEDEPAVQRFLQEARALARMQHPNVVDVYDYGLENGHPFIVMELLNGEDLKTHLDTNPEAPVRDRLRIVLELCEGLRHAHEKDIVHRDVKPRNIHILTNGRVKVTDFGLAKVLGQQQTITRTSQMIGTPAYMAPEQIEGGAPDRRGDIFAAGIVLYEALNARHPFAADTDSGIMFNIVSREPHAWTAEKSLSPAGAKSIVSHALEKDPENRYQTARAMASDLRSVIDGGIPAIATRAQAGVRNKLRMVWGRARGRGIGAAVVLTALVIVSAAIFSWSFLRPSNPTQSPGVLTDIKVSGKTLFAMDQRGEILWPYEFDNLLFNDKYAGVDTRKRLFRLLDLNGDGVRDLVFAAAYDELEMTSADQLCFFSHDGKLLRGVPSGRRVFFDGKSYSDIYSVQEVFSYPTAEGRERIVVLWHHKRSSPALVQLFDTSGRCLREYTHFGHLNVAVTWDVDGDGTRELLLGGTHNGLDCAVVVVLPSDGFGHEPDEGDGPLRGYEALRPEPALYYIRLPNLGIDPTCARAGVKNLEADTGLVVLIGVCRADRVEHHTILASGDIERLIMIPIEEVNAKVHPGTIAQVTLESHRDEVPGCIRFELAEPRVRRPKYIIGVPVDRGAGHDCRCVRPARLSVEQTC